MREFLRLDVPSAIMVCLEGWVFEVVILVSYIPQPKLQLPQVVFIREYQVNPVGIAGAVETLCGQAYGAGLHPQLGIHLSAAIICLILTCIPVSILWVFMDKLLVLIHQDQAIAAEAGKYSVALISSFSKHKPATCRLKVR